MHVRYMGVHFACTKKKCAIIFRHFSVLGFAQYKNWNLTVKPIFWIEILLQKRSFYYTGGLNWEQPGKFKLIVPLLTARPVKIGKSCIQYSNDTDMPFIRVHVCMSSAFFHSTAQREESIYISRSKDLNENFDKQTLNFLEIIIHTQVHHTNNF